MKIALTGATGFIGSVTLRHMVEKGWEVQALVRPGSRARRPDVKNVRWITGDITQPESLSRLVKGMHTVVHCAGAVRGVCREDFEQVNVQGTALLAEICSKQESPPDFLLISSLSAREPGLSCYAASKQKAEAVLAASSIPSHQITVLRPPAVYGPGDREMMPLFQAMASGICPIPGSGSGRVSLIHVHDLAEAILCLIKSALIPSWKFSDSNYTSSHIMSASNNPPLFHNRIYELHDGHTGGYSWHDIVKTVTRVTGRRIICIKIPVAIVKMLGLVNIGVSKITGRAPMLTPGKVRELVHPDWTADNNKITKDTGWEPGITLEQGLREILHSGGVTRNIQFRSK